VTTDKASERVAKLRQITVARGATEHEAATATALAAQISARFGLDRPAVSRPAAPRPQVARYARSAPIDRRSSRSLRFVAFG
jgi:hypothetical protein